jgi:hypothetical protein
MDPSPRGNALASALGSCFDALTLWRHRIPELNGGYPGVIDMPVPQSDQGYAPAMSSTAATAVVIWARSHRVTNACSTSASPRSPLRAIRGVILRFARNHPAPTCCSERSPRDPGNPECRPSTLCAKPRRQKISVVAVASAESRLQSTARTPPLNHRTHHVRHEALCLYPRLSQEDLGRRFLGAMTELFQCGH